VGASGRSRCRQRQPAGPSKLARLRGEVKQLRKANEILKAASCFAGELDPIEVSAFVDERRADFGVELICQTLGVSA